MGGRGLDRPVLALMALTGLVIVAGALLPQAALSSRVAADFDGDGADDIAIGTPKEDSPAGIQTGVVNVLFGSVGGSLVNTGNQKFTQTQFGDPAEPGDEFGNALAAGDFDADGFDDLAVGVRREDLSVSGAEGMVHVVYGGATGLQPLTAETWTQGSGGIVDSADPDDSFGTTLTTGDFDDDGADDLLVGVPEENAGATADAGAISVIFGTAGIGLTSAGNQIFDQDSANVEDAAEAGDYFGNAVAAGDFDGDGVDDAGIGVHGEDVGAFASAGAIAVIYGAPGAGLDPTTSPADQFWHQDSAGINDNAEQDDFYGNALASGDLSGDGVDDLAVGVISEDVGGTSDAGAVSVLYGSGAGLGPANDEFLSQDATGILGVAESLDNFGDALGIGDFDGDGADDLVVGVPEEDLVDSTGAAAGEAGTVHAIYGAPGGITVSGDQRWDQDSTGIKNEIESADRFGDALSPGDFSGDGIDDLAVGIPFEETATSGPGGVFPVSHGALGVLFGTANGLDDAGDQIKTQNSPSVLDRAEANDNFAEALPGEHVPD